MSFPSRWGAFSLVCSIYGLESPLQCLLACSGVLSLPNHDMRLHNSHLFSSLLLLILPISWMVSSSHHAQAVDLGEGWYPKIIGAKGLYKTTPASTWPLSYDSNGSLITNVYGHTSYMVLSLAGLAAKACLEGTGDQLIEVDTQAYPYASQIAHADLLGRKGLQDLGTLPPWDLLDIFRDKGIVAGFVVYHYETGSRGLWNYTNGGPYDPSSNAATVYAHQLNAVLIEQSLIATALSHGLSQLADCRGITQEQCWQTFKDDIDKHTIVACDPKVCWNRDYAVATGCFILFPMDPNDPLHASSFYRDVVLPTLEAPFPVLGWAGGDEYSGTYSATINGGFNTATSYDTNLLIYGALSPGVDEPFDPYRLNLKGKFDPGSLEWERDVHYTAFIMSDGDFYGLNNTYIEDTLGAVGEYFGHHERGSFPMTWSCAAADLIQTRPSSVRTLAEIATANDSFALMGGGYYYPDLFPDLLTHMQRIRPLMDAMELRTWIGNFSDYDSAKARQAQGIIASTLNDLSGLFPIQYSPYTAGHGNIYWTDNSSGYHIPVISAKHAIWANSAFEGEGSPLAVAESLASAPRTGSPDTTGCFDWTIIHIWSFFENCSNMNQTGAVFNPSQGIERCYASALCCYDNLPEHVRVVSAEELAWQAALHLHTEDSLLRILDQAEKEIPVPPADGLEDELIQDWRDIIADSEFSSEPRNRESFLKVKNVLDSVRSATAFQDLNESFEDFELGNLPQRGWIDSMGDTTVTTGSAYSGQKSLHVTEEAEADKLIYPGESDSVWFESRVKLGLLAADDTSLPSSPATAVLRFSNFGILAFDGNGSGGGEWRRFQVNQQSDTWLKIGIRLDYSSNLWELYVNGQKALEGLGFVDNSARRLHGMKFKGEQLLDDVLVRRSGPTVNPSWDLY